MKKSMFCMFQIILLCTTSATIHTMGQPNTPNPFIHKYELLLSAWNQTTPKLSYQNMDIVLQTISQTPELKTQHFQDFILEYENYNSESQIEVKNFPELLTLKSLTNHAQQIKNIIQCLIQICNSTCTKIQKQYKSEEYQRLSAIANESSQNIFRKSLSELEKAHTDISYFTNSPTFEKIKNPEIRILAYDSQQWLENAIRKLVKLGN